MRLGLAILLGFLSGCAIHLSDSRLDDLTLRAQRAEARLDRHDQNFTEVAEGINRQTKQIQELKRALDHPAKP